MHISLDSHALSALRYREAISNNFSLQLRFDLKQQHPGETLL